MGNYCPFHIYTKVPLQEYEVHNKVIYIMSVMHLEYKVIIIM